MLQFYYARPSLYSRPVWLTLLEKGLKFEAIATDLSGSQFEPEFVALNPFSKIPVLVDNGFRVIESQAILDYLEAQYPTPGFLPENAQDRAVVRMVQMVTANELVPAIVGLLMQQDNPEEWEYARMRAIAVLRFFEELLGEDLFFAGDRLTLAELTAGSLVPLLPQLEVPLDDFTTLKHWSARLLSRPSWQQVWLSDEEFQSFKRHIRALAKIWQRRRKRRVAEWSSKNPTVQPSGVAHSD